MTSEAQLLTAQQVADLLQLQARTVRTLCRRGLLPPALRLGVKGRSLRWRLSDVERFLRERAQAG